MRKGDLVIRVGGFDSKNDPQFLTPGVIIRGPYESAIAYTKDYIAMVIVADILIDNFIYEKIPLEELKKINNIIRE